MARSTAQALPHIPGFTLIEPLYLGQRTQVYRAQDLASERLVAIKILNQAFPPVHELVRLRTEYAIANSLTHPGVIQSLELKPLDRGYALILEDYGAISLRQYLEQRSLSVSEVLQIGIDLAQVLHYLT